MGRIAETILQPNIAWAKGHQNPMVDLRYGGQMGYSNDLSQWVSNQAYVQRNLIPILIEAPTGFQLLENPEYWVGTLRALIELHALSITGLNGTLTVEVQDTAPVGGAGEMHQDFVNVTRARSTPVLRFNDKYGLPVFNFLQGWIMNLMMNPDTKVAAVATTGSRPADMLSDVYAATVLFIEPDPTHTKVVKAFLCTNFWPHGTGDYTGRRELTASGEPSNIDIEFSAITQVGIGVDAFAQQLLDSMSITGANPYNRPAFVNAITADVAATTQGYSSGISNLANTSLKV